MTPPVTRDRATRDRVISPVMALALCGVLTVVVAGDVWSFREQTDLARELAFDVPWLLPVVLDGLALALAAVSFAASLDGRAALGARAGTGLAIAASSCSNLAAAALRLGTTSPHDQVALVIAAGIPVAANLAWEVILGELRRQVMRRRGLPAPVPVPWPRVIRVVLSPRRTLGQWRVLVLELTDPRRGLTPDRVTVTPDPMTPEPVTPPVTPRRVHRQLTPGPSDPLTPPVTPPRVHPRDPLTPPVTPDPMTPEPSLTPVTPPVTPITATTDLDTWVHGARAAGHTTTQIIRAATTDTPLPGQPALTKPVSESTVKRSLRRTRTQETA